MSKNLSFQKGNAKLHHGTVTVSLPSGYTCPGADSCLAKADRKTGKVTDGEGASYRCFSASQEAAFPSVRAARWRNLDVLRQARSASEVASIILESLPTASLVRVHVAGDFFSQAYFDGWMEVARARPQTVFYAYTKSIPFWVVKEVPTNFRLVASRGGRFDFLIDPNGLPSVTVVKHPEEARALGLPIDHTDELAWGEDRIDFALLLHGTQPKGTPAASAIRRMKQEGVSFSYPRRHQASYKHEKAA